MNRKPMIKPLVENMMMKISAFGAFVTVLIWVHLSLISLGGCEHGRNMTPNKRDHLSSQSDADDSLPIARYRNFDFIQWQPYEKIEPSFSLKDSFGLYGFDLTRKGGTSAYLLVSPDMVIEFQKFDNEIRFRQDGVSRWLPQSLYISSDRKSIYFRSICMREIVEWVNADPSLNPKYRVTIASSNGYRDSAEVVNFTRFLPSFPGCYSEEFHDFKKFPMRFSDAQRSEEIEKVLDRLVSHPQVVLDTVWWSARTATGFESNFFLFSSCLTNIVGSQIESGEFPCR